MVDVDEDGVRAGLPAAQVEPVSGGHGEEVTVHQPASGVGAQPRAEGDQTPP